MARAPSYYALLSVNVLAIVIALVILGIALNIMYGGGLKVASLDGLPIQIYYVVVAFSLFVFIVSLLGVLGGCLHSRLATIVFTAIDLLLALVVVIIMIFVLMYANGLSTTATVDNSIKSIQDGLEKQLVIEATSEQDSWKVTQAGFNCCGIDFEETYSNSTFNYTDADFINLLQPGDGCADTRNQITLLHEEFPTYSSDAQNAVNGNTTLLNKFCKKAVSDLVRANTTTIGVIAGVLVLLQVITAASAIRLLTKVPIDQGGFVAPKDGQLGGDLAFGATDEKGGPRVNQVSVGNTLA